MKTLDELVADPRTVEAKQRLKSAGITEAWWRGLLVHIADLPRQHAQILRETKTEAATRRGRLADQMRGLASEISSDPEASTFYPAYDFHSVAGEIKIGKPHLRTAQPHEHALSLAEWLAGCAKNLEAGSTFDTISKPLDDRRGTELRPFVIRGVLHWIDHYLECGRRLGIVTSTRARNVEVALLASALLDQEITANNVTQANRKQRRTYFKE